METYGATHLVMLGVFVLGLWPAQRLGRARRSAGAADPVTRGLALLVLAVGVGSVVLDAVTRFDLDVTVPLHLSDLAWMLTAAALWTRSPALAALSYLWSLTLVMQAIVTPSLGEDFPDVRFLAFWFLHLMDVWVAVLLVWGVRLRPTWRGYRVAVAATSTWAVLTSVFNTVAGTNYGYLQRKPGNGSALDLLGPWPWYVLAEVAILVVVWALLTWPWTAQASSATRA